MRLLVSLLIINLFLALSCFDQRKIEPRVVEISLGKKDEARTKFLLSNFSNKSGYKLLSPHTGNFDIIINSEPFEGEDSDSVAYALIRNSDCEITINSKTKWNKTKFKLVLFHELGHCFGLDHDAGIPIMDAEYEDEDKQIKSLPSFFLKLKEINHGQYYFNSGITRLDESINFMIDPVMLSKKDEVKQPRKKAEPKELDWEN